VFVAGRWVRARVLHSYEDFVSGTDTGKSLSLEGLGHSPDWNWDCLVLDGVSHNRRGARRIAANSSLQQPTAPVWSACLSPLLSPRPLLPSHCRLVLVTVLLLLCPGRTGWEGGSLASCWARARESRLGYCYCYGYTVCVLSVSANYKLQSTQTQWTHNTHHTVCHGTQDIDI